MGIALLAGIAILALVIIAFRRAPDRSVVSHRQAKWLLIAGLIFMGIFAAFLLFFGIAEMISGDLSGAIHLVSASALALLMFLVWRRPLEGGAVLVGLGVLVSFYFGYAALERGGPFQVSSLMAGIPFLLSGILFLLAVALARRQGRLNGV